MMEPHMFNDCRITLFAFPEHGRFIRCYILLIYGYKVSPTFKTNNLP